MCPQLTPKWSCLNILLYVLDLGLLLASRKTTPKGYEKTLKKTLPSYIALPVVLVAAICTTRVMICAKCISSKVAQCLHRCPYAPQCASPSEEV